MEQEEISAFKNLIFILVIITILFFRAKHTYQVPKNNLTDKQIAKRVLQEIGYPIGFDNFTLYQTEIENKTLKTRSDYQAFKDLLSMISSSLTNDKER